MAKSFNPLPDKPNHPELEREVLDLWEREGTFEHVRERVGEFQLE